LEVGTAKLCMELSNNIHGGVKGDYLGKGAHDLPCVLFARTEVPDYRHGVKTDKEQENAWIQKQEAPREFQKSILERGRKKAGIYLLLIFHVKSVVICELII